jgi:hypothetical protein
MQLFEDGSTWDPAAWDDWIVALGNKELVTSVEGFKGVFNFLNAYYMLTSCYSNDIKVLLDAVAFDENEERSPLWYKWVECVEKISNV